MYVILQFKWSWQVYLNTNRTISFGIEKNIMKPLCSTKHTNNFWNKTSWRIMEWGNTTQTNIRGNRVIRSFVGCMIVHLTYVLLLARIHMIPISHPLPRNNNPPWYTTIWAARLSLHILAMTSEFHNVFVTCNLEFFKFLVSISTYSLNIVVFKCIIKMFL